MRSDFARTTEAGRSFFSLFSRFSVVGRVALVLVACAAFASVPGAALAEDEEAAEEAAADAVGQPVPCNELAAVRYPFLTCVRGPSGRPVFAEVGPGMTGSQLKLRSKFVRGKGHWGNSGIE